MPEVQTGGVRAGSEKQFRRSLAKLRNPAANIIFIEKRWSYPVNLRRRQAKVPDLCWHERKALWRPPVIERETRDEGGLQPTRSLGRTNNVFLTKMYDLLPDKRTVRSARLNCYEVSIMGVDFC